MKNIQSQIEDYLRETKRPGMEALLNYMDKTGFYNAPCSSQYHLAQPGGLAEHSLNVLYAARQMVNAFFLPSKSNDLMQSVTICALLHDLGKAGQYGKPNYVPNELPFEKYHINKELLYIPHEIRSVAIAQHYIALTEEEQFAILYHNGLYGQLRSIKGNETPLYMILHFADMWASRVIEKE